MDQMGEVELNRSEQKLIIHSHIITYGDAADPSLTASIREEIELMWNEPDARIIMNGVSLQVVFNISAETKKEIEEIEVLSNLNPRNNYFRIEEFAHGNISFVDGLGCNTGYFKLENLYKGSTTAAHEYGHTLGLDHPEVMDIRGQGVPGIMYPRGTLVDPPFQYEPEKPAGVKGGTMHPIFRKVKKEDIKALQFHRLNFKNNISVIGTFSNVYHDKHGNNSNVFISGAPIG